MAQYFAWGVSPKPPIQAFAATAVAVGGFLLTVLAKMALVKGAPWRVLAGALLFAAAKYAKPFPVRWEERK